MTRTRRTALLIAGIVAFALTATARVISYAPYTDRAAFPAHQARTNRYFALVEADPVAFGSAPSPTYGQLVIYDSTGAEPPRVVFPADGSNAIFTMAAARESSDGTLTLLVQSTPKNDWYSVQTNLSTDGGRTWKAVDLPSNATVNQLLTSAIDTGGRYVASRYSPVRIGSAQWPFVVLAYPKLYAISANGTSKLLYDATAAVAPFTTPPPPVTHLLYLVGTDYAGVRYVIRTENGYFTVDLDGRVQALAQTGGGPYASGEGFIATDGSVYVEENVNGTATLWRLRSDSKESILSAPAQSSNFTPGVFAIPTADYNAAWVIKRGSGQPTVLYQHIPGVGLVKQWEDITAPEVEALHAGLSGKTLLVQVHRPRPAIDQQMFKDPALAVWHVGDAAPRAYDELFMNEQMTKGFVHLDVDKVESGEPFVFNSGTIAWFTGIITSPAPPPSSGGSDVVQEWGVVRASLKQRLVLPSIGRVKGSYGSDWVTDVIVQNPLDVEQRVNINFIANGADASILIARTLVLAPRETHLYTDALKSMFNIDSGIGAMTLEPEAGVTVTSRTYTKSAIGTLGFGMNAVDELAAAASPRFPVTFAGAFAGSSYRTNMTITYPSGLGSGVQLTAASRDGLAGTTEVAAPPNAHAHQQINGVTDLVGLPSFDTGALIVKPRSGSAIVGVYAVDNRTNDSTYFPPDLPSSNVVRTIPAIGHLDGANGSKFRSDLYLYNPADSPRSVTLQAKAWDSADSPATLQLTLLGHESRVIRDALFTVFGKTGIARLRFSGPATDSSGVRVTSRTYSVDADGGTYGFLMPPLNNFQIGGSGDTLQILGAVGDPNFRVNIGLVELTGFPTPLTASARIELVGSSGKSLDSFTVSFPTAGGTQLNDVLRARSITASGPIVIRITPTSGTVGAYATMTDNGTNDSVYLAANLEAKQ